jgi:predicted metalloprotease
MRRLAIGGGGLGLGGLLVLLVLSVVFKQDFLSLGGGGGGGGTETAGPVESTPEEERLKQFIGFVLDDVQTTWDTVLPREGGTSYQHAKLVLFRDAVQSACGLGQSATGPFYCPGDGKVYIDLGFYQELSQRFGAPGDFAQAYVLAHEIGHHVQNLLGTMSEVQRLQQRGGPTQELSVRLELQADCYAGVWGHSANRRNLLEPGDVEEGLGAAAAVGDDRIQRETTGQVSPESFTHGTSEQRAGWFRRGLSSGRLPDCDTFAR